MVLDKEEHRKMLWQLVQTSNFEGQGLEQALELKYAIAKAVIKPKAEPKEPITPEAEPEDLNKEIENGQKEEDKTDRD